MPFANNKRLPSPPSNMSEAPKDHHYVVSPEEGPDYRFERQRGPDETWSPVSLDSLRTSPNKAIPSVTERSTGCTGWQPPTTSKPQSASHWWPWEWLCELLALGSLGVMVFVLWYYQDRPQADWRQSYFTLNGLVAFLATLIKTGLVIPVSAAIGQRKWLRFLPGGKRKDRARRLGDFETFDEASRGSLGSAKLVISLNAWDVACLGAFIIILSVFFNAITQNVLSTYESSQPGTAYGLHAGRVPRSETFNRTNQPKDSELTFGDENYRTDISTLAAVYNGIMSEAVADVPISCGTGNCTWPIIPTLGICGACIDMKDKLEYTCTGGDDPDSCSFSIPGGLSLVKPTSLPLNGTTPIFVTGPGSDYIFNQTDVVGEGGILIKMSYNFIGQSYKDFVAANVGSWIPGNRTIFSKDNVLAYECGLWHCLQARSINASDGIIKDTLVDFRNGQFPREEQDQPDMWPLTWRYIEDPSFNVDNISAYDSYSMLSIGAMNDTLVGALSGSITITPGNSVGYTPTLIPARDSYSEAGMGSAADCLHAAWKYADDIDAWWARLAKSMTNNIRMNGVLENEESNRYNGIAWTDVVYTEVRWLWLIFPATLVALSMLFLSATMIASWKSGLKPWKSFILPVLYTRLEGGLQEEWKQEFAQGNTLLSEVKGRWAALDNSDDAWVFRHVAKESGKMREIRFAGDTSLDG